MIDTQVPFYDAKLSYQDNYDQGPFGLFAEPEVVELVNQPTELFGIMIDFPLGIPAGPLLSSTYVIGAWQAGFSVNTYKTVRSEFYPSHQLPNIVRLEAQSGKIEPMQELVGDLEVEKIDVLKDGITNSFGVPSQSPSVWQLDVQLALQSMQPGQSMILSFMGTKHDGDSRDDYIADFVATEEMVTQTDAPILEVNLSCPNYGSAGLICNDLAMSTAILEALQPKKANRPLIVKIGYFRQEEQDKLIELLKVIHQFADGVAAINTIPAVVLNAQGQQLLPGSEVRKVSGACGRPVAWAGLEMAERIMAFKTQEHAKDFVVVGVGGVVDPSSFQAYQRLGVDLVQTATGAMWLPNLAQQIRQRI